MVLSPSFFSVSQWEEWNLFKMTFDGATRFNITKPLIQSWRIEPTLFFYWMGSLCLVFYIFLFLLSAQKVTHKSQDGGEGISLCYILVSFIAKHFSFLVLAPIFQLFPRPLHLYSRIYHLS